MQLTRRSAILLLIGPIGFFLLFFVVPFAQLVGQSLSGPQGMTFDNYANVLADAYYWKALFDTLLISLLVTLVSFFAGYPLAYFMIFHLRSAALRRLIYVVLVTPLFTSNIVRAFGWIVILGRRGMVNAGLLALGVVEAPIDLLYGKASIIIGLTYILLPLMVLTVCSILQNIDRSLIDAARDLGARPSTAFFTVTLPLSLPGVVAGSIIIFALSASAYVIPSILSGGREIVMSMLIFQQYMATFRPDIGATLSVVLLVVTLTLIAAYAYGVERRIRVAM